MKDRYDSFPMGKDRGESSASPARKKKPHERPQSCRMSYAKQTIQRWRSLVEQAYDSKSGWEWKQDRRTWDRLEALTLMCFNANRSRRFTLTRYLKEFAMYFGCHPRTIRRALADGCYWREEVFGANVERIAFFSAERMEIKHRRSWGNRGRPDAVARMDAASRAVFDAAVGLLMADRFCEGGFRPSPYAALIIASRGAPEGVRLPCEKTVRNYAHAGKHGLTEKALRRKGSRPKDRARKNGETPLKVGHTFGERPAGVRDPKTIGHLEGDTVCGPVGRKGVYYSFIDRLSSKQYLIYRDNRKGVSTLEALRILTAQCDGMILSITFDRGKEFDDWKAMQDVVGAPVYYADPYTSCQRAKNENNHLLVRRTSPKRHRLVHRSVKSSLAAAEFINDYPRRKFGGRSSNEVHAAFLASA